RRRGCGRPSRTSSRDRPHARHAAGSTRGNTGDRTRRCARADAPRLWPCIAYTSWLEVSGRERLARLAFSRSEIVASARDDGANLDLVVVLDHLAVRQQLVTADDHGRAGENVQLG